MIRLKKKVLIFAPHPDDETFGCGGTIAKKISEGYEIFIIVMTDGRYAYLKVLGVESDPTPEELREIRMQEVKRALKILGVPENNIIFLDFIDGTLNVNEENVENRIVEILKELKPHEIYLPSKRDGHPDHRAASKIIKHAIKKVKLSTICYEYSITHRFARIGLYIDYFLDFIFRSEKVYVDVSEFLNLKKLAINEFRSEIEISKRKKPIVSNSNKFIKEKEIFYVSAV